MRKITYIVFSVCVILQSNAFHDDIAVSPMLTLAALTQLQQFPYEPLVTTGIPFENVHCSGTYAIHPGNIVQLILAQEEQELLAAQEVVSAQQVETVRKKRTRSSESPSDINISTAYSWAEEHCEYIAIKELNSFISRYIDALINTSKHDLAIYESLLNREYLDAKTVLRDLEEKSKQTNIDKFRFLQQCKQIVIDTLRKTKKRGS